MLIEKKEKTILYFANRPLVWGTSQLAAASRQIVGSAVFFWLVMSDEDDEDKVSCGCCLCNKRFYSTLSCEDWGGGGPPGGGGPLGPQGGLPPRGIRSGLGVALEPGRPGKLGGMSSRGWPGPGPRPWGRPAMEVATMPGGIPPANWNKDTDRKKRKKIKKNKTQTMRGGLGKWNN